MASLFPDIKHSHHRCVKSAKLRATKLAEESGKKFGANQVLVFDALLQSHQASSAYEIVESVAKNGKRLQAVQVYRALETLIKMGIVHRIQSMNAYIACTSDEEHHNPQLLFCSSCKRVAELTSPTISELISKTAEQTQFKLEYGLVELVGLCPECTG
ncbi:MAG: transcriptional repressor [Alphaproteobacteria bacterium]|nr:transcriptional repressor [Alphaproteobacteria bacterium]